MLTHIFVYGTVNNNTVLYYHSFNVNFSAVVSDFTTVSATVRH